MRNLNRSAYTYRRFRSQNKAKNEAARESIGTQPAEEDASLSSNLNPVPEKEWLEVYFGALPYGAVLVGKKGEVLFANAAFGRICACDIEAPGFLGMDVQHLLSKLGVSPENMDSAFPPAEFRTTDGRVIDCSAHPLFHKSPKSSSSTELWLFKDVSEDRAAADQLVYLAEHDMLTGLFNRHRFHEELLHQMKVAGRQKTELALLYIDLDNFKMINDKMGHRAGDELLKKVAIALSARVRSNEFLARLGGDEFAILVPAANDLAVRSLYKRIQTAIEDIPFEYPHGVKIGCSIGSAKYPSDTTNEKELMARADAKMYETKPSRRKKQATS